MFVFAELLHILLIFSTRNRSNQQSYCYCSTMLKIGDLDETQLHWLAYHLGHKLYLHRKFRLNDSTIELANLSWVLLAMDEEKAKIIPEKIF